MVIDDAVAHLQHPSLAAKAREALAQWPGAKPADVERITTWMLALRDDLVGLIREVGDPDEARMTIAINYIELKSRWIALNTRMNYQTFRTGSCDTIAVMRGSAISQLIGHVEELLTPQDIDTITQFLSEPVRRAA